ncbi:hypothetical protein AHIS1636_30090 [Arthrobacter mangrovi]|uniref:Uncharacterized protein n=1 Tax=Arthrobacter mangrovi TaxID=2966350 RepID=A0ABQ5MY09_9MICC|nr:hypothetical protein AHIS1636_30090 [Arthrobacter mangrovi]
MVGKDFQSTSELLDARHGELLSGGLAVPYSLTNHAGPPSPGLYCPGQAALLDCNGSSGQEGRQRC